ncbi:MAG: GIY-YIG nuclease family protein [Ignavibacteriales bacterium]|nr:GIY-YIG nuclease family protein [Ignavibacteriales bacterium]
MSFTVYILHSSSVDKYYIGQTNNLERRINDHNSGYSNFTKTGKPWTVVYSKEFTTRSEAMKFERKLKSSKSKLFIEKIIKSG